MLLYYQYCQKVNKGIYFYLLINIIYFPLFALRGCLIKKPIPNFLVTNLSSKVTFTKDGTIKLIAKSQTKCLLTLIKNHETFLNQGILSIPWSQEFFLGLFLQFINSRILFCIVYIMCILERQSKTMFQNWYEMHTYICKCCYRVYDKKN